MGKKLNIYLQGIRESVKNKNLVIAIILSISIICLGVFFGWYNNKVVPVNPSSTAHYTLEIHNPLSFMSDWDGPSYLNIAKYGYLRNDSLTNFFPLYPLTIYIVNKVISSELDSALIISWLCLIGAVYFYLKILEKIFSIKDKSESVKGILFFLLFPSGVFLLATYTESLFALLALGSIYFAIQRRFLPSALMAMLATATHDNGVFILLLSAMILLEEKEKLRNIILTLIIGSLGLVSYMTYLAFKFHDIFEFINAQKSHGWLGNSYLSNLENGIGFFNIVFILLLLISAFYWWKRRKSFSIYSFLFICIPIIGGQIGGFNRYVLMAFPLQFMLYDYLKDKRVAYPIVIALMGISWAYFLFQYAGGYVGG